MRKILFGSIAALGLVAAPAMAQNTTGTVGGGAAASTPGGSVAGGATAGAQTSDQDRKDRKDRKRSRGADRNTGAANSATTHGSGTIYTDRNRATGGVTAGGTATGTGDQATSTTIDAYGATDRTGSTGEVYGDATATSTTPN